MAKLTTREIAAVGDFFERGLSPWMVGLFEKDPKTVAELAANARLAREVVATPRKHTRFVYCGHHAPMFHGERRDRKAEVFCEGGWSHGGPCRNGLCRCFPGTDLFVAEICTGEMDLPWTREEVTA